MNINIEKEYKILLSKSEFYKLLSFYPEAVFHKQVNTYYDTHDMAIKNAHGAMRIRETDHFLFTLKMHSEEGLLEFETSVLENNENVFHQKDIQDILQGYAISGPFHKITSLTTHRAMIITDDAELCFDISEYNGKMDYEIEYEYKRPHDGLSIFNNILRRIHRHYEVNCASKIKRAMDSVQ